MTREEILNTPELVDFMLDESVIADSREKLRKRLEKVCNLAIKALEQEPKIGRWIFHKSFDNGHKNCNECIECSQCHTWFGYDCYNKTPYCPNCGRRMKGEYE